jgi:sirohydrochlorin ferrochelatase
MTPVVLLAHGSPDPRSSQDTTELAARVAERLGRIVVPAFLDNNEPDLTQSVSALAEQGFTSALVLPAFLSHAFHVRVDIPAAVLEAQEETGVELTVVDPLGPSAQLLDAMDAVLPAGPAVLATAGTSSVSAQWDFEQLARVWSKRRGAPVFVAYASQAKPDVPTAISELEGITGRQVSVGSFVLFQGVLPDRIAQAAGNRACTQPLCSSDVLTDLIVERIQALNIPSAPDELVTA